MSRIRGGTSSQTETSGFDQKNFIFQDGVNPLWPSDKFFGQIRILPGFHPSVDPSDPSFSLSFMPYRLAGQVPATDPSGVEEFSEWFVFVNAYRFWGNAGYGFLSPATMRIDPNHTREDVMDPLQMCREYVRNSKRKDLQYLVEKQKKEGSNREDKPVLPHYQSLAIMNCLVRELDRSGRDIGMDVRPVAITHTGFSLLKSQLDAKTPMDTPQSELDPQWYRYLLGDVTSLEWGRGAMLAQWSASAATAEMKTWTLAFSSQIGSLHGACKFPLSQEWWNWALQKRLDLCEAPRQSQLYRIMSFQEIIDLMCDDGCVPREIIKAACGHMANVPDAPHVTYQTAVTAPGMGMPPGMQQSPGMGMPPGMQQSPGMGMPPGMPQSPMGGMPPGMPQSPMGGMPPGMQQSPMGGMPPGMPQSPMGGMPQGSAFGPGFDASGPAGIAPGAPPPMQQAVQPQWWVNTAEGQSLGQMAEVQIRQMLATNPSIMVCSVSNPAQGWQPAGSVFPPPAMQQQPPAMQQQPPAMQQQPPAMQQQPPAMQQQPPAMQQQPPATSTGVAPGLPAGDALTAEEQAIFAQLTAKKNASPAGLTGNVAELQQWAALAAKRQGGTV